MKTRLQLKFLILSIFMNALYSFSQETILDQFSAENVSGKVLLAWTIKSGNTCNGIRIYRSDDSLNYTEIGDIQGVCGNSGYAVNYTYQDDSPSLNKVNYYRLNLGGQGLTYSVSVQVIDVGQNDYFLEQNPIGAETKLYFKNLTGEPYFLTIYSADGMHKETKETSSDYFELNQFNYSTGLYYFVLSNSSTNKIQGKFMVVE